MANQRERVPTVLDDPREDLAGSDLWLAADVEEHGFHYVHVGRSDADAATVPTWQDVPDWTYSIGLYLSYGHPEIVVFTLDTDIVGPLLWDLGRGIRAGRSFEPGVVYDDALPRFERQRCAFESVASDWIDPLFGYARWFYKGADFPVLQYLWPDRNGNFAWDEEATAELRATQRELMKPPFGPGAPPPPRG